MPRIGMCNEYLPFKLIGYVLVVKKSSVYIHVHNFFFVFVGSSIDVITEE